MGNSEPKLDLTPELTIFLSRVGVQHKSVRRELELMFSILLRCWSGVRFRCVSTWGNHRSLHVLFLRPYPHSDSLVTNFRSDQWNSPMSRIVHQCHTEHFIQNESGRPSDHRKSFLLSDKRDFVLGHCQNSSRVSSCERVHWSLQRMESMHVHESSERWTHQLRH